MSKKSAKNSKSNQTAKKDQLETIPSEESTSDVAIDTPTDNLPPNAAAKKSLMDKLRGLSKKQKISAGLAIILVTLMALFLTVKPLRLLALNLFSDADMSVLVRDSMTEQPLAGADVTVDEQTVKTDMEGLASFSDLDYGDYEITASKNAYESTTQTVNLTQNEQRVELSINPTGTPVVVKAVNWVTGDPITGFTVANDEQSISASSNEDGEATLSIPVGSEEVEFEVSADGYNQASFIYSLLDEDGNTIPADELKPKTVKLSQAGRHHFLSNRDGKISLWSSNYDGTDAKVAAEDTGKISGSLPFSVSSDGKWAVMTAPIKGERNDEDTLLSELYVVNLDTGEVKLADEGNASFRILQVDNDRVIYTASLYDESITNRGKIKTYNYASGDLHTAFTSQGVEGAVYVQNRIFFNEYKYRKRSCYYCSSGYTLETKSQKYFVLDLSNDEFKALQSSSDASTHLSPDNPNKVYYQFWNSKGEHWIEYDLALNQKTELDGEPDDLFGLAYRFGDPSPGGHKQAWVETRDGDGTLLISGPAGDDGQAVDTQDLRIDYVVRWINDDLLIVNGSELGGKKGDYVVDIASGSYALISSVYSDTYYYRYGYYGI